MFTGIEQVTAEETRPSFDVGPRDVLIETHYSCISAGTEWAKLSGLQTIDFPCALGTGPLAGSTTPGHPPRRIETFRRMVSEYSAPCSTGASAATVELPGERWMAR